MPHPDEEILAAIALGERPDPASSAALEHIGGCDPCADLVAELSAVRSLTSGGLGGIGLQRPPSRVWAAIVSELDADLEAPVERPVETTADTGVAATLDDPADTDTAPATPAGPTVTNLAQRRAARDSRRLSWVAGAAAAGLVLGLLGGRALFDRSEPTAPELTVLARTVLQTLDTKTPVTDARLVRAGERIAVSIDGANLPATPGYLEVWLINTDGKRMVSLGVLERNSGETLPVTQAMLDEGYVILDISREQFDEKPQHSGDSVARGSLTV